MDYMVLPKEHLDGFIVHLSKRQKVAAPVAKGFNSFAFEEVSSAQEIALVYIPTIIPPKKYFMPPHETLLEYDTTKGQDMKAVIDYEKMVLFGVHTCDLAGIQCLNMIFSDHPKDYNYLVRKNNITIIGLECNDYCDKHASCALMNTQLPNGGYDLLFTDIGDVFMVEIATQTGDDMTASSGLFSRPSASHRTTLENIRFRKRVLFQKEVPIDARDIPSLFSRSYDDKVWDELDHRCLACGNCTNVCPTCYCFDIYDEPALDQKTGKRCRKWDSCQLDPFARVAGGHNFRLTRGARQRHRYFRKFSYPVEKYFRFFCIGCGRCTRTCMAGIDLKETLKALITAHPA